MLIDLAKSPHFSYFDFTYIQSVSSNNISYLLYWYQYVELPISNPCLMYILK